MVEEGTMLQAIREAPGDDAPRMVYADWLQDRGDPRGELIQLQCALSKLRSNDSRYAAIRERAQQLLQAHGDAWGPFSDPRRIRWVFERGFPCAVGHRGVFHHESPERGSWIRLFADGVALYIVTAAGGTADVVAKWFEKGHRHSTTIGYALTEADGRARIRATGKRELTAELSATGLSLTLDDEVIVHALEGRVADSRVATTKRGLGRGRMMKV